MIIFLLSVKSYGFVDLIISLSFDVLLVLYSNISRILSDLLLENDFIQGWERAYLTVIRFLGLGFSICLSRSIAGKRNH